jgi:NAD(P)-dependent dehydrogenase (short-subunit alcohol dehydrogenase family)
MDASVGQLLSLDGKTALVTGGATGIGEGIARLLAAAGACVVIGDIDDQGAAAVAAAITEEGHRADALHLDVTDPASATEAVARTRTVGGSFDILVNNAGSYHEAGSIIDQTWESWKRAIDINYVSVFACSKPAAQTMVEQGRGGSIVNISSVDAFLPCLGTGYDSAKAAVVQFTRSLAVDLAPHKIRVNSVAPGAIDVPTLQKKHSGELPPVWPGSSAPTGLMGPMMAKRSGNIPLERRGDPQDIARAVLFLAAEASSYVTGQTLLVDGGWTLV